MTSTIANPPRPARLEPGKKLTAAEKMARIPIKIEPTIQALKKPSWLRVKAPTTAAVPSST